jgi:hypothetical protein
MYLRLKKLTIVKKNYSVVIFVHILSFLFLPATHGQIKDEQSDYYNWFDEITGIENSNLFEGTLNVEKYITLGKSYKFLDSPDYLIGNITYDGEPYFNIDMKYDLYEDEVLLGLRSNSGIKMLQLIKDKIDEFVIDGRKFINLKNERDKSLHVPGFHEVLMETSFFTLLKRHKKIKYTRYKKSRVFHKFVGANEYYLEYENHFYNIKGKKGIARIFPDYKTEMNKHSVESLRKTDMDEYIIGLLRVIEGHLISEKKTL